MNTTLTTHGFSYLMQSLIVISAQNLGVDKWAPLKKDKTVKVTLSRLSGLIQQYGKHKNSTAADLWQMVVMDGSVGLFKIAIQSGT